MTGKAGLSAGRTRVVPEDGGFRTEFLLGEKPVSRLWVFDLTWRVGGAHVRMGGIGGVGTDPEHRNRGYSRRCLERSCEHMREQGYDMSSLFGISAYYNKWGFASVMAEPRLSVSTRSAEEAVRPRGVRIRPFNASRHGRGVLEVFELNNRERSGSLVRPPANEWKPFKMGSGFFVRAEAFVATDGRDRVLGYASHDVSRTEMICAEVGCRDWRAYPAITAELARRAVARRTGEIVFLLPVDHPFAAYIHRWDAGHRLQYAKWGAGMARIINLESTFRKCAPEFARRARRSGLAGKRFSLTLATDIGSVSVAGGGGKVRVGGGTGGARARMPQSVLTQLLLGYRGVGDAASAPGVGIPARAVPVLEALFPSGMPYMCQADRF